MGEQNVFMPNGFVKVDETDTLIEAYQGFTEEDVEKFWVRLKLPERQNNPNMQGEETKHVNKSVSKDERETGRKAEEETNEVNSAEKEKAKGDLHLVIGFAAAWIILDAIGAWRWLVIVMAFFSGILIASYVAKIAVKKLRTSGMGTWNEDEENSISATLMVAIWCIDLRIYGIHGIFSKIIFGLFIICLVAMIGTIGKKINDR